MQLALVVTYGFEGQSIYDYKDMLLVIMDNKWNTVGQNNL